MAQTSLSVSVSMPIWMYEDLQDEAEKHGVKFSQYLQEVVRDHEVTPFERMDESVVCVDENYEKGERPSKSGAA